MPRRDPVGDRFVALNGTVGPHRPISAWWISLSPVTSKFALSSAIFMSVLLTSYSPEANVSIVIVASLNAVRSLVQMKAICGRPGTALDPIGDHDRPFGLVCVHHSNAKRSIPLVL